MANLFPSPGGDSIKDRVAPTTFLSLLYLEGLRGTFMTKNCGPIWAHVKIEIVKAEKM